MSAIANATLDGQHQTAARELVGYLFGRIHGTVMTPNGGTCQGVETLAVLDTKDARRGYLAGRYFFFYEATPQERRMTDDDLIERLQEIAQECIAWHDPDEVWQYAIARMLGELSGLIFPVTPEEHTYWKAEEQAVLAEMARQQARQDTEPLDPVPAVEYTV